LAIFHSAVHNLLDIAAVRLVSVECCQVEVSATGWSLV